MGQFCVVEHIVLHKSKWVNKTEAEVWEAEKKAQFNSSYDGLI